MDNTNLSNILVKKKPISDQYWPKRTKPTVTIICHTYNHQDYIRDAIESFLIQETNFRVEIIIHDDASSDKTTDIIKEYADKYSHLIKPIYNKTNKFSQNYKLIFNLFSQLRSDYIALCDGDDFWTSRNKLQTQFETLEENSDHIFCGHLTENFVDIKLDHPKFVNFEEILKDNMIAHTSSFFFKNIFENKDILPEYLFYGINGDYALSIFLTKNSSCIVLPYRMSYYRITNKGVFTSLKENTGLIKKALGMLHTNQLIKYHFGPKIYLYLSKKNLYYSLSIIKRNILSFNIFGLIKIMSIFCMLLFEYTAALILLYFQRKHRKKID